MQKLGFSKSCAKAEKHARHTILGFRVIAVRKRDYLEYMPIYHGDLRYAPQQEPRNLKPTWRIMGLSK